MKTKFIGVFTPNKVLDKTTVYGIIVFQVIIAFAFWFSGTSPFFPTPSEIITALGKLITSQNLIGELTTSLMLSMEAMLITIAISLFVSYLTVIPFFKPIGFIISKARFLTLVGLSFIFLLMTSSGHSLKISLLVFGMSVFFITSMIDVINSIPKESFVHARTLRMKEWQVVWEVIILGKFDQVFEVLRQNFAISWMMLTMVEGLSRSEGGIGALLLNQNKAFHLDAVFAIQILILLVGIFQDYLFGVIKDLICPYAKLSLEKK